MNGIDISTFQGRLQALIDESGKNASEVAQEFGVSKQALSAWVNGKRSPKTPTITSLAAYFNVNIEWLLGFDSPKRADLGNTIPNYKNIVSFKPFRVPVLGNVAAGQPIFVEQEHDSFIPSATDIKCDFALKVKGNSMYPTYHNGDWVYIREVPTVDNGEVAVVIVGDEATLKRVYRVPEGLRLVSDNPDYPPLRYEADECEEIHIIGKPVAFLRSI